MTFVSVVLPAHNEEEAIEYDLSVIAEAMAKSGLEHEIIVVDDGSTDHTADLVRKSPQVILLSHKTNLGTGAALKTGIKKARGEIVIMTDADGTYPNHDIPKLLAMMDQNDMVIGARTREMGTLRWLRTPAKTLIRLLASYLTGVRIPDLNSGLRCFKKEPAEKFFPILPSGHSWVSTITLAFLTNGYKVKYVPIEYFERKGRSHFHPVKDTYSYITLVLRTVLYFDPLKFFLPVAAVLIMIGAGKTVADILRFNFHIATSTVLVALTGIQIGAIGLLADLIVKQNRMKG